METHTEAERDRFITLHDGLRQAMDLSPELDHALTEAVAKFRRLNLDRKRFADLRLCEAVPVPIRDVWIDPTEQRPTSWTHVTEIIRRFSETTVMPIQVYRDHGRYIAWDGQHTAMALHIIATRVFGESPATAQVPVAVFPLGLSIKANLIAHCQCGSKKDQQGNPRLRRPHPKPRMI